MTDAYLLFEPYAISLKRGYYISAVGDNVCLTNNNETITGIGFEVCSNDSSVKLRMNNEIIDLKDGDYILASNYRLCIVAEDKEIECSSEICYVW